MANVVIYTKDDCPFSKSCKDFFNERKIEFTEFNISNDDALFSEMKMKTGRRTDTPQVFINGNHIGSFDDIKALDSQGELNNLLA
ncbi:glutaredoxin 3 [Candidatus Peregrinibacteria bacterium]|nr:glutaredoxin 3 [Candidatus Peregrinibacteria bacterium]